ncbi:hypothetical protein AAFF_G00161530 [Aldrovandia affinis]|uniref:THAP-type domain-containing protein n=1 Tax=Aldrovandia affinis TaxID=143900 RepID=A0AAD7RQ59_9TELE|nr:hypothetical protein AAFF_G00161530 [Aldrovandia affinis]
MPRRWVIGGCSNTNTDGVTLHFWPKNEKLAHQWGRFARIKRADWVKGTPGVSTICGVHFLPTDYDGYEQWKAGFVSRLRLENGAVSTVNARFSGAPDTGVARPVMEVNR